eukprot:IDg2594t1
MSGRVRPAVQIFYARTREHPNLLLSTIRSNAPLLELWLTHQNVCATYALLEKCVYRLNLKQRSLVPADLSRKPVHKRKRPYEPFEKHLRTCGACGIAGHFASSCPCLDVKRLADRKN